MTVTRNPDQAPPTNPPTVVKRWAVGSGEAITHEWTGDKASIDTVYDDAKALAEGGGNIAELAYNSRFGRASLVAKFGRESSLEGFPPDVTVIEELYAVDILKDISEAPYFSIELPEGHPLYSDQNAAVKLLPLSDDQVGWVKKCAQENWSEDEITDQAADLGIAVWAWVNWTTGMKELRYHLLRGVTTYYETGFVLRRNQYGVRTAQIQASFMGINAVADGKEVSGTQVRQSAPVFKSAMDALIAALPDGEWLYRPPQAEYGGKGRWRITNEWQWAEKWSIVYGGSFNWSA